MIARAAVALALAGLLATTDAAADPPLVFVGDPHFGMEGGVRSFDSLGRLVSRYELALPDLDLDETRPAEHAIAIGGRLAKLAFVDSAIADFESTAIHEVYGHGARARDLGESPNYQFRLPGIYCFLFSPSTTDCSSATETSTASGLRDRDLLVRGGGMEANHLTAWWIDERMVATRGDVHHADLLVYFESKLTYGSSFLSPKLETAGALQPASNDVDAWVGLLQDRYNRYRTQDRTTIARRLHAAYLWNLFDPMLAFAVVGTIEHLWSGDRHVRFPLPHAWGWDFYASPRFTVSPFGAEQYVDVFLGKDGAVLDVYGRVATSGLARADGIGVRAFGVRLLPRLTAGAELDVWNQPQILLDVRNAFDRPQRWGANVGLAADWMFGSGFGVTGRLAYKSSGWLVGQPIDEGPHGYVGGFVALP